MVAASAVAQPTDLTRINVAGMHHTSAIGSWTLGHNRTSLSQVEASAVSRSYVRSPLHS